MIVKLHKIILFPFELHRHECTWLVTHCYHTDRQCLLERRNTHIELNDLNKFRVFFILKSTGGNSQSMLMSMSIVNCMFFFFDAINVRFGISFHCLSVSFVRYHYNTQYFLQTIFFLSFHILEIWKILNMCRIKILRAYFIYHSVACACVVPFLQLFVPVRVNRMPIKSCHPCALQFFVKRQKSQSKREKMLSQKIRLYAVGAALIIMGCVVENRIFHFCRPFHLLLLLIHSFEFHYLLYVNNFSHLLVCLQRREFIKHQLWKNAILSVVVVFGSSFL